MIAAVAGAPDIRAETVGRRLRRLRLEQGLSQRDLSAPGITYAYISRIEAGTRQPSVKALRMLARKLGVTPEYLETGSELAGAPAPRAAPRRAGAAAAARRRDRHGRGLRDPRRGRGRRRRRRRRRGRGSCSASRGGARGDHAGTIEHLSRVLDSELVTPVLAARRLRDARPRLRRRGARRARRSRSSSGRSAELARAEPGNRAAEVRYAPTSATRSPTSASSSARRPCSPSSGRAPSRLGDRYTRVRLYWSLGRRRARGGAAAGGARQLPPGGRAARGDRGRGAPRPRPRRLRRGRAQRRRRSRGGLAPPRGGRARCCRARGRADDDLAVVRRMQALCALRAGDAAGARRARPSRRSSSPRGSRASRAAPGGRSPRRAPAPETAAPTRPSRGARAARAHGGGREHADSLRAYGRYLRDGGREREALEVFERAAEAAASLRRPSPASTRPLGAAARGRALQPRLGSASGDAGSRRARPRGPYSLRLSARHASDATRASATAC